MRDLKYLFVPYELSVKLKEKGFNDDCFGYYSGDNPYGELPNKLNIIKCKQQESIDDLAGRCLAPIYQQITNWLRENYDLIVSVDIDGIYEKGDDTDTFFFEFKINEQWKEGKDWYDYKYGFKHIAVKRKFKTYYEAQNKAIEEALKLI